MTPRLRTLALLIPLALGGCALGPDFLRPKVETPTAFKQIDPKLAGEWKEAAASPATPASWWRLFEDPVLDDLIAQIDLNNQNLKIAEARYRSARAGLDTARSSFFPRLDGDLSASRGTAANATTGGSRPVANSYALTAAATWEIDLWGRIRRSVEAADAKAEASAADLAAARLSLQALLTQTYFQLRSADAQIAVLERSVAGNQRFLKLTQNRREAGVASPLDVAQAETQLGNAQTQLLEVQSQRAQYEHALATLVGKPPAALSIATAPFKANLPATPPLIPSTLLEARPDIIAAERRVAAANAGIGIAKAAFFPVLSLGASGGYRSSSWANLLDLPNRVWSLGPALALALFDGGARSAAVKQADAAYDEAVASYRQTVLTAFQEVEDNLASSRQLTQEAQTQGAALAAARRAREIAENQYAAGISSALNVITAQSAELSAELNAFAIQNRRLAAATTLLKNAGGQMPQAEGQLRP